MLLFSVAPVRYRKILFVLKHLRRNVSLASHYIKAQGTLGWTRRLRFGSSTSTASEQSKSCDSWVGSLGTAKVDLGGQGK